MAADTIAFIEKIAGGPVRLAGYSAGAIVALWVAVRRPDLVSRLVLVSGAFDMAGMIVRPQAGGTMPEPLVAMYAEVSPDGRDHFPTVVNKVVAGIESARGLDAAELAAVGCPALVVAADDDIVTLEHTVALYRGLPRGQLAVVPNTSHLLLHEKPDLCAELIGSFLTGEPAPRMMPMSRG
jgi:pimeloyl-ACP methyl ester carboxylesterase